MGQTSGTNRPGAKCLWRKNVPDPQQLELSENLTIAPLHCFSKALLYIRNKENCNTNSPQSKYKNKENWIKKWINKGKNKSKDFDSHSHNTTTHCPCVYQVSTF